MFSTTINTSITKFTAVYWAREEYGKIKSIIIKGTKVLGLFGVLLFGLIALISPMFSSFLQIEDNTLLLVLFASLPLSMVLPIYQGALRGMQRFSALGLSTSSWAFLKVLFGVSLVALGYGVFGGLLGIFWHTWGRFS